jgi:hypothetical protein
MKLVVFVCSFVILSAVQSTAQMSLVFTALKNGDVRSLTQQMDDRLEIGILDDQSFTTKDEASKKLETFFRQNRPVDFQEMHKGSSRGRDSKYTIGTLETRNGTFRVYIFAVQQGRNTIIQELRIDRE